MNRLTKYVKALAKTAKNIFSPKQTKLSLVNQTPQNKDSQVKPHEAKTDHQHPEPSPPPQPPPTDLADDYFLEQPNTEQQNQTLELEAEDAGVTNEPETLDNASDAKPPNPDYNNKTITIVSHNKPIDNQIDFDAISELLDTEQRRYTGGFDSD